MNVYKLLKVKDSDKSSENFLQHYLRDGDAVGAIAISNFQAFAN